MKDQLAASVRRLFPNQPPEPSGLFWALLSPIFLGITPIMAKLAYSFGVDVYTVATFRTILAALMLWLFFAIVAPHFIRTSTIALASSLFVGGINGIGSLFYYLSLELIDASLGQLINISYLVFVTILLRLIGQNISWLTIGRTILAIVAVTLLTFNSLNVTQGETATVWGVGLMLIAAFAYAVQLVLSQRVLADIPAPTMALYALSGMAAVVTVAWLWVQPSLLTIPAGGWWAVFGMGIATALARLTMFIGIKKLGSLQTALLSVAEALVTIGLAAFILGESLTLWQWLGAMLILASVLLIHYERRLPKVDWWQPLYRRWMRPSDELPKGKGGGQQDE